MNSTKQRQYARLAEQLELLQHNLLNTTEHLDVMSRQCNNNIVDQLGKVSASWFIGSDRYFQDKLNHNDNNA
ncbi:hypothetical protein Kpol_1018p149 [Vanderwaltozyma polyspora DSM 70294]|uniref:DASH complex subunit HSK3 n=1 Tax=Vanderwaltozyma polyspora (strain ATCC 22028 / DSM 70294 / BCRC 21397 / CBS 2163 / NBRC 10782 / NRRL Y-8283 / UCD 57-17) TaxID=436907 RepID=A7TDZ1_VANPO|nr:uncharacterized protein Kpol_1018p149 [Vanderwaltozyma polyspora DSM 70294]EDO19611.1 hypothetical protein Kpol_1018p149 [Vanderwaltozyma polyspora DSM 70294]